MGHDLVWCEKCREYVYFDGHPEEHWITSYTPPPPKKQPKKRTKR